MKRIIATLVVILLWPGCNGMFLPPLSRGISSILGTNNVPVQDGASVIAALRSGQIPDFTGHIPVVVGTTNQLRQIQERWPILNANAQFRETDKVAQRPLLPFVPLGSADFGMPWIFGERQQDAKLRSNHIGSYAQPIEEPEAPAPAYGKPVARPEPSYGGSAPSNSKPASNYPQPEASSGYGKPEPPIDSEPQPVPEAADLPAVNEDSSSSWNHATATNEVSTHTTNHSNTPQSASSSSASSSIIQTASISSSAMNSASDDSSSNNQQDENNTIGVLQDVVVQQTEGNQSNTDFFQPQLPADPSFTSDNVIRPASRPPSSPSREPLPENEADAGHPAENTPSSSSAESEISQSASSSQTSDSDSTSVVQEASIEQNANDGTAPIPASVEGSNSETNPPFVSDNVIRPASRPVSSSDAAENDASGANAEGDAPTSSDAEIVQSASAGDGSVVQDASIEQIVHDGSSVTPSESSESASSSQDSQSAQTPAETGDSSSSAVVEQNAGEVPASPEQHETETPGSEQASSDSNSEEQGGAAHEEDSGNMPPIDDGADVFVTNHTRSESSFNETKTTLNRTEHISTTIISNLPGPVPSLNQQTSAKRVQHPFLGQAQKLLHAKIMRPGFPRLLRRRRSVDEADLVDSHPASFESEGVVDEVEELDEEFDLNRANDTYAVLSKEADIEEYFCHVADMDKQHCIAKFLCEIAPNPKRYREAGKQIDEFFTNYDTTHSKEGMRFYKDSYLVGRAGREACIAKFPECAHEDLDDGKM